MQLQTNHQLATNLNTSLQIFVYRSLLIASSLSFQKSALLLTRCFLQAAYHFSNQLNVLVGSNYPFGTDKGQRVGFKIQVVHLYEVSFSTEQLPLKFIWSDCTDYRLN